MRQVTNELVNEELLVQQAAIDSIVITDAEVSLAVQQQLDRVRGQFQSEAEYRAELVKAGFGTPDEYRRTLTEDIRRAQMQQRLFDKLRRDGRLPPVAVSEAEITAAFEANKASLPRRPAQIAWRQIIVAPKPSPAAVRAARLKADSLLAEIRAGGDFEQVAKRESMDPASRELGGDLGWSRRGRTVPAFERVMFALPPGQVSPVFETEYGWHILRVDRVQPAEVKARHILIRPVIDSADVARARAEADSVAAAWKAGASYDSLVARHHDPLEDRVIPLFDRAQLPPSYATAMEGKSAKDVVGPFAIDYVGRGVNKFVVLEVTETVEGGEFTIADYRDRLREQLSQERAFGRLMEVLREETYVSIRL
jgi:peptidyl-prolyl cis-trans isomerase SurA